MYPAYQKGIIKPTYALDGQVTEAMYGSYGALTSAQKRAGLAAAGIGVIVAIGTTWTFAVGPWAVKQFKPEWGYGKRLVTSFLAGSAIGLARKAIYPDKDKLAYGAHSPGNYGGWNPATWFQGGWKADLGEQQGWAEAQLDRAQAGSALTSIYGPGCCTTGGGDITATSFTQSPTHVNGMHTRSAYYLALTARVAMGAGWSQDAIRELIKAADDTLAASKKDYYNPEDPAIIQAGFQEDIDLITKLGAQNPPLPDYAAIVQKLANMGNLESINFAQEQDINVVGGTITGTAADLLYKAGIGEGGAVARAEEKAADDARNMKPFLIVGGVALAATIGYVFLKKD